MKGKKKIKLDVGAGRFPTKGFVSVDRYEVADIEADMWALPCDDDSVEEIRCTAAFEHIPFTKVGDTLKEWYRVLRPGGKLMVDVPDMDYVCRYWLNGKNRGWALVLVYGVQTHPGEFHRMCWNVRSFAEDIQYVGFRLDEMYSVWNYNQEMLRAFCTKPRKGEKVVHFYPHSPAPGPLREPEEMQMKGFGPHPPKSKKDRMLQLGLVRPSEAK